MRRLFAFSVTVIVVIGLLAFAPTLLYSAHAQQPDDDAGQWNNGNGDDDNGGRGNNGNSNSGRNNGGQGNGGNGGYGDGGYGNGGGGGSARGGNSGGGGSSTSGGSTSGGSGGNGGSGSQSGGTQNSSNSAGGSTTNSGLAIGKPVFVVNRIFNLENEAKKIGKVASLFFDAEDAPVAANIPLTAIPGTQSLLFTVTSISETVIDPLPPGTELAAGTSFNIEFFGDGDQPIEQLGGNVEFTVDVDAEATPGTTLAAFLLDENGEWLQLPTSESDEGVAFTTTHLTLFAVLRVPTVTQRLVGEMNTATFTGASGTSADRVAASIGDSLLKMSRFEPSTQTWQAFTPGEAPSSGAPGTVNQLETLNQGDALLLDLKPGADVEWVGTDIVIGGDQRDPILLWPGLNTIAITGIEEIDLATVFGPVGAHVESVQRFNPERQRWDSWIPGAPPSVNTLNTASRLDVLFVRVRTTLEIEFVAP